MRHLSSILLTITLALSACGHGPEPGQNELRFHMSFDNQLNNDLDLHVIDPSGNHLTAKLTPEGTTSENGTDCGCGDCMAGPEENIFWLDNQAGTGLYEIWVQKYAGCDESVMGSNFTLSIYEGHRLKASLKGELYRGQSQPLYYEFVR